MPACLSLHVYVCVKYPVLQVADILSRQPRLLDPFLTSLRPLLLEHVLTCRLASQATHTSPYTAPPPAVSHKLLTDLVRERRRLYLPLDVCLKCKPMCVLMFARGAS